MSNLIWGVNGRERTGVFFPAFIVCRCGVDLFRHRWHKEQVVTIIILEIGRSFQGKMPGDGKNIGNVRSGFPIKEEFATGQRTVASLPDLFG